MRFAIAACLGLMFAACASAPPPAARPADVQVMVLGVWHFNNPGRDLANANAEDVRAPQRQAELAAVTNALAKFKPTIVAVERETAAPAYTDPKFAEFNDAMLASDRSERVQIGFRLARAMDLKQVYGIDEQPSDGEPDYFPFEKLQAHAQATGQGAQLDAMMGKAQTMMQRFSDQQKNHSIAQLLVETNTGEIASGASYYEFMRLDRGEAQPGAELGAYWFMRNAKIFSKLAQVTKPGDRVVVIFGAGHKYWLDHLAANTPGFVSIDPVPYLKAVR